MKRMIRFSAVLIGLITCGVLQMNGQIGKIPSEITAFGEAKAQSDGNGRVAVSGTETDAPDYQSDEVSGEFSETGPGLEALSAGGLYVGAYYYAVPNAGYYFDHWVKLETGETFAQMPRKDSVFSAATTSNFDGTGTPYFYPLEEDPFKDSYPLIGTYKAVFKSVPVYSCTDGQLVYTSANALEKWDVIFSTGYATSLSDFNEAAFTNATAGGTFVVDWSGATFADNVVTVPVSFTAAAEGTYTADLTLAAKGGASFKATIKAVVEPAAASDVMVKNGAKQLPLTWAEAMVQAVPGDTVQLLNRVDLAATQGIAKALTLDLNGRRLSGSLTVNSDVTIIDSKLIGKLESDGVAVTIESGKLTLKRGELIGSTSVDVKSGSTFIFTDGKLTASQKGIVNNGGTVTMSSGEINVSSTSEAAGIQVSGGSVSLEGGKITASVSGASGRGVVVSAGTLNAHNVTIKATGTSPVAMDVIGGTVSLGQYAVLSASTGGYGSAVALKAGSEVTIDGARFSAKNTDGNMSEVTNSGNKVTLVSGYFVVNDFVNSYALAANQTIYNIGAGQAYTDGYRYFVGTSENAKDDAVSVCAIGTTAYGTLEEALLYAQNNPSEVLTILMVNNYTLPAGYYTLPANATLLVPAAATQKESTNGKPYRTQNASDHKAYLTLTFATGANLDVFGTVETSGYQLCGDAVNPSFSATSTGAYGLIALNSGSSMTLEDGATVYAWGFITGEGEIHARRGSQVREYFQVYDWPGALNAVTIYNNHASKKLFPLNQYFIQNVEAATVYHPGSRLYASFAARGGDLTVAADNIQIVGVDKENAMFLMENTADAENTWVRKWYDVTNDKQVYDVNSGAHLGSVYISLPMLKAIPQAGGMDGFDSKLFVLPLTSNMKIHLLTGAMDITQNTEMLPGTEIEVNKEATVTINEGVSLYMFDTDQWDKYARNAYAQVIGYTPSWGGKPTVRDVSSLDAIGDAKLNVHGTFDVKGRLLTTTSGANIFSNNADAGTVRFTAAAPASADDLLYQFSTVTKTFSEGIATVPALLRNSAGQEPAFVESASTPAGQAYCFVEDKWRMMTDADPFVYDNYGAWYVKPGAYVSIATQPSETQTIGTEPRINADHTYSDAAGEGRLFILVENQWWEVTLVNNLYRGTNGKYYVYDDDAATEPRWHEKQFSVYFVNWDGSDIATSLTDATAYDLSYGTMPFYNGTNPTRAEDVDYTYTFTGWTPEFVAVTEDATYTATYEATQRKYTIIFLDETGKEIERHFMTRDEMPECKNTPSKTGHFLTWTPGIGAVVGNQTYQAVFTPEPPTEFTITFKNYDGSVLQSFDNVPEGTLLASLYSNVPTKPATTEYTYTFTGWQPAITAETAATKDMSFTAQYSTARKSAVVTFEDENGNQIGETQNVEIGQTPVAPVYTKDATAEYTYTVAWIPAVAAVVSDDPVTYSADITAVKNKYTVTVTASNCSVIGVGTYEYGTEVTLSLVPAEGYTSAKWGDNTTGSKEITVTGNVTLSASGTNEETPEEPVNVVVSLNDVRTIEEPMTVDGLTIEASATAAGQIIGAENIQIAAGGNVYYKYVFNAAATTWYDFAVPFECDGATVKAGSNTLTLGRDYHIISFNGATRATIADEDAATDNSAWEFLSKQGDKTLVPGRLYMIYFFSAQNDVTFTKKAGAGIVYNGTVSVNTYDNGGAATALAKNWNGIANWRLYTAQLTAGTVTYGQFYIPTSDSYATRPLSAEPFYVGKPVFVQVETSATVAAQPFASGAPIRRAAMDSQECVVTISDNDKETDRVYLLAAEDAKDEYVIGQDLAKVGTSRNVAQMWVNRYNANLSVNTVAADVNGETVYPLGIYAPKAGTYTITAPQAETGVQVWLTYNGIEIADLTRGAATVDLARGTTTAYAVRISGKRGMPTGINDIVTEKDNTRKVISNGVMYIVREGKVYDAQGREVK